MSEIRQGPAQVGVRELRQNLSVYLDRVKEGETLEVTEHGRPVAQLAPLAFQPMSTLDRLVAEGTLVLGTRNLADLGPPVDVGEGRPLSEILQEMRDEDDR